MILILLFWSSQHQLNPSSPTVLHNFCGGELAAGISSYVLYVHIPIVSYVAMISLVASEQIYYGSHRLIAHTIYKGAPRVYIYRCKVE